MTYIVSSGALNSTHSLTPHRQRKSWITQDTLLLVERKRKAKVSRLKSDDAMAEYTELCKRVKKIGEKGQEDVDTTALYVD